VTGTHLTWIIIIIIIICEREEVRVFWNQGVHTNREVTENRPDTIIKNKKRENMHTGKYGNTSGQKCHTKGSRKETERQEFMYRDAANVEHGMCYYSSNNWSHLSGYKRFKEACESHTGKTFNRFATEGSCTWNIAHNAGSTAV
jgi:hypothetical protein